VILQPITKSPTVIATKRDNHRVSPPNKLSEDNEISSASSSSGYPGRRGWVTELEMYGNLAKGPGASATGSTPA